MNLHFILSVVILLGAPPALAQAATETTLNSEGAVAAENIEIAKRYMALAGIEVPPSLDKAHIPEVREIFAKWMMMSPATAPSEDNVLRVANQSAMGTLVDYLHPRVGARAARMLQFQEQQQELPDTIFAQVAGSSSGPTTLQNPQHYLASHALTVKFSELFLTSSDLSSIYKSLGVLLPEGQPSKGDNASITIPITDCTNSKEKSIIRCLARARGRDRLSRALTGVTLNVGASQRSRYIQGVLFTPQNFPDIDYTVRGQLDFDPTALFVTAANWGDAVSILNSTHNIGKQNLLSNEAKTSDADPAIKALPGNCVIDPVQPKTGKPEFQMALDFAQICLDSLAGRHGFWEKALATLIPTFQFKKESQFDFIKQGGAVFVPAAFPEPSLNTFSLTFDLRRLIPSTKTL